MPARAGIASVHDAKVSPACLRACQDARAACEPGIRVYAMISLPHLDSMMAAGVSTGFGDEWIPVGGVKLVRDGSISERTALLSEPCVGRPGDHGMLVADEEQLFASARKAHAAGWQIGTHANGDLAIARSYACTNGCSARCPAPIRASASNTAR